jgi:hypothetical protein
MYYVPGQSDNLGYDPPINIPWNLKEQKNKIKNKIFHLKEDDKLKNV